MIAIDTNILVYAHREESTWHVPAHALIEQRASAKGPWAIPWPCIHEFLAIVTHPRIYKPATPHDHALDQVAAWMEADNLVLLSESEGYWDRLRALLGAGRIAGPLVHDARIAALCLHHDIDELWTADRDFSRFPSLRTVNPLIA